MNLTTDELLNVKGGATTATTGWGTILFLVIGGLVTLLAGIFDGITNPSKCNN